MLIRFVGADTAGTRTNDIYALKELSFSGGNNKHQITEQHEAVMSTQQGDVREAREMGNGKCRGQQMPPWRWDIEFTWLQDGATHGKIRSEHCSQGDRKRKGPGAGARMACSRSTESITETQTGHGSCLHGANA